MRELRRAKVADKPIIEVEVHSLRRVKVCQTKGVVGCRTGLDKEHERGVKLPREEARVTKQPKLTRRDLKLSLKGRVDNHAQHGPNRLKTDQIGPNRLKKLRAELNRVGFEYC